MYVINKQIQQSKETPQELRNWPIKLGKEMLDWNWNDWLVFAPL